MDKVDEKEYIEKRAALNAICKSCDRHHPDDKENCPQKFAGCMEFYNVFELQAADVEPVRHGWWVYNSPEDNIPYCSDCLMPQDSECNFCHSCGARMDGGAENG